MPLSFIVHRIFDREGKIAGRCVSRVLPSTVHLFIFSQSTRASCDFTGVFSDLRSGLFGYQSSPPHKTIEDQFSYLVQTAVA